MGYASWQGATRPRVRPDLILVAVTGVGCLGLFTMLTALVYFRVLTWFAAVVALVAILASVFLGTALLFSVRRPRHVRTRMSHGWVVLHDPDPLSALADWFTVRGGSVTRVGEAKLYVRTGTKLPAWAGVASERLPTLVVITAESRPGAGTVLRAQARDDLRWTPWHGPDLVVALRGRQRELLQSCVALTTSR